MIKMNRKITWKDNLYLILPFIIMFVLYQSSSMSYEEQSLLASIESIMGGKPLYDFFSSIEFLYGGEIISIQEIGYFAFIEFFIRKGAHFFIYFLLGFFWFLGLRKRVRDKWLVLLLSIMLAIGYASFDELQQSFNPGRTGLMADVLLDTAGAFVGVLMAKILSFKKLS